MIGDRQIDVSEEYAKLLEGNGRQLTNMDEFRTSALHFKEFGRYCNDPINPNPRSRFMKFWKEERRRCMEGYHAGHDYIPGYYYWYLNYSPIQITEELQDIDEDTNLAKAERIQDFPKVWDGDYYWYHYLNEAELKGLHAIGFKTRGRGFSFKGGSMLSRNFHLYPNSNNYALAHGKEYLIRDGLLTKAWDNMDFISAHTPFGKKRHYVDQALHKRASYQKTVNGKRIESGYKSEIMGISLKDNPDLHRGKRGKLMLWEEGGSFPALLKAWNISLNSMKQGRSVFGLMVLFGTGGEENDEIEGLTEIFLNPRNYQVHAVKNVLDEARYGKMNGFFAPEQVNREGYYDENGNSDIAAALKDIERERAEKMQGNPDPNNIIRFKAEGPTKPEEAMININTNNFPINDAMTRRTQLESEPEKYLDTEWIGRFVLSDNGVKWRRDSTIEPIRKFPIKSSDDREGAPQIFEPPSESPRTGKVPNGIYIAGIDPYDQDDGDSLGSIHILNLLTDRIVFEYTGRPKSANDFYELCRRALLYYNAVANYENNNRGLFTYFDKKHSLHLLCETPSILQDVIKSENTLSRKYGTPGTTPVNKLGRNYLNSYLRETCVDNPDKTNVYRIRSIATLREIEKWNKSGNFDRVSALQMLMVYREECKLFDIAEDDNQDAPSSIDKIRSSGIGKSFHQSSFGYNAIGK